MTVPLDAPPILRGPRETLLLLTESYLHAGELGPDARQTVARLAGRVGGVPDAALPDWGPLAAALAAMLRGEAERAFRVVLDALQHGITPRALQRSLLGLGVRAAIATERPVLARRWRAGLVSARDAARFHDDPDDGREAEREAVRASLPEFTGELLAGDDATGDGASTPRGAEAHGGGPEDGEARGGPVLHVVMDAYRGEVVSVPITIEVVAGAAGEGPPGADALDPWTIRVASQRELPELADGGRWHVRFVGRARALDVRSSDDSLVELRWRDDGFDAVMVPPEYVLEMDVPPEQLVRRVTHVVVVPEAAAESSDGSSARTSVP